MPPAQTSNDKVAVPVGLKQRWKPFGWSELRPFNILCVYFCSLICIYSRYNIHERRKQGKALELPSKGFKLATSRFLDWHLRERKEMGGSGYTLREDGCWCTSLPPFLFITFLTFKAEPLLSIARLKYPKYCCTVLIMPLRSGQVGLAGVYS